ncbi:hypothetical protein OS176_13815 [Xanthomonadaceae bacterium XH05]|nr:hypothetical protein [Xanthomonadaceae bacterium XH05]
MSERYLLSPCCEAAIEVYGLSAESVSCPACEKVFEVREDLDFAEFSTSSFEHFKWSDDGTHVVRYYFHNMTLDELEGVAERIKILQLREKRPLLLLPLLKATHDCLKRRLQQCLTFDRVPNLSAEEKARIEADLPFPGNNVVKLLGLLARAYPAHAIAIENVADSVELKVLLWVRNKDEHLAMSAWPMPSYVHTDKTRLPSDSVGSVDIIGVPLAVQLHNFAIDVFRLMYDIDPKDVGEWQYDRLERQRLHCTV